VIGNYGDRTHADSSFPNNWGDSWSVQVGDQFMHQTMEVKTGLPMRNCGPTRVSGPPELFCTHHHKVTQGYEFKDAAWEEFFNLNITDCKNATQSDLDSQINMFAHVTPELHTTDNYI
jgi:hypothetical protein